MRPRSASLPLLVGVGGDGVEVTTAGAAAVAVDTVGLSILSALLLEEEVAPAAAAVTSPGDDGGGP